MPSLLSHSFRRSVGFSQGFVSDPTGSVPFLTQVFFGKLYDGIFVTQVCMVVTKVNYQYHKINCQLVDGMVKGEGCGWLLSVALN